MLPLAAMASDATVVPTPGEAMHDHGAAMHDHGAAMHDHGAAMHDHGAAMHDHGAAMHDHDEAAHVAVDAPKLFREYCSVCHGDRGDGNSRAKGGLNPPPRDFTRPQAAIELTRERMINSVTHGRPGTAMSAWGSRLSDEQIAAVVDYIREVFMPAVTTETTISGRRIFAEYCSVCHGDRGQTAVWARSGLQPPPANFTDPVVQQKLSRDRMILSVTYGRPQTAMASWKGRLSEAQINAVVDYVREAFMGLSADEQLHAGAHAEGGAHHHEHGAHGLANLDDPLPNGLKGDPKVGGDLYQNNCVACHGLKGDGHGPRAYFIFPKPRDFGHPAARAEYSRLHLFEVISHGSQGTEMPAWNKVLTDQEIAHIAEYVFDTFIRAKK